MRHVALVRHPLDIPDDWGRPPWPAGAASAAVDLRLRRIEHLDGEFGGAGLGIVTVGFILGLGLNLPIRQRNVTFITIALGGDLGRPVVIGQPVTIEVL